MKGKNGTTTLYEGLDGAHRVTDNYLYHWYLGCDAAVAGYEEYVPDPGKGKNAEFCWRGNLECDRI